MAIAAAIGLVWTSAQTVSTRRQIAHEAAQERCKGATDSDCQHLVADLRSAAASEASADGAWAQLWLNMLGLLGLIATVVYAREAWLASRDSAESANRALSHSQESTVFQLRPYIFVDEYRWYWHTLDGDDASPITEWSFVIKWRNMGQTPASRVRSRGNSGQNPGLDNFIDNDGYGTPDIIGGLGPGQVFTNAIYISVDKLAGERLDDLGRIHLWCWVDYDGIPGQSRHRTEWHTRLRVKKDPTKTDCVFSFEIADRFNGYDEGCYRAPQPYNS